MSVAKQRSKTEYALTILVAAVCLAYLALFAVVNFAAFANLCTADMYEDTLVARLMWEKKTLFPDNYLFGNQFYVIATPVLSALFYGLTGSMNTAMGLATTVMSLLTLLSLEWMLRPWVQKLWVRLAALLLFMGAVFGPHTVSREDGQLFFVMCSYYACYAITLFIVMGDYVRARQSQVPRVGTLILALLLCFSTGMQSLRQTCVSILPVLFLELVALLRRAHDRRLLFDHAARFPLIRAGLYTAANAAGVLFIKLLHIHQHTIYRGGSIFSGASVRLKVRDVMTGLRTVSGLEYAQSGRYHAFFLLMFLSLTALVIAACILLFRRRAQSGKGLGCCWWLLVIACVGVIAASFVTNVSLRAIYLFPYYALPAVSYALLSDQLKPMRLQLLTAFLSVLLAVNLYYSYSDDLDMAFNREPSSAEQICNYAMENGYELVYGNISSTAPQIAVHSDGKLIAGGWEGEVLFRISPYINIKDIYYLSDYSRAIFVFLPTELDGMRNETAGNGAVMTFVGQYGPYSVYTSSKQLLWPISENVKYNPDYN